MSKLKQLKEKRASIFSQIDQIRTAADGREMTAEEQQRWDTLLADYNKVDKEVEAEERFEQIRRHQLEQAENNPAHTPEDRSAADRQYEEAFRAYLLSGSQGATSATAARPCVRPSPPEASTPSMPWRTWEGSTSLPPTAGSATSRPWRPSP